MEANQAQFNAGNGMMRMIECVVIVNRTEPSRPCTVKPSNKHAALQLHYEQKEGVAQGRGQGGFETRYGRYTLLLTYIQPPRQRPAAPHCTLLISTGSAALYCVYKWRQTLIYFYIV